jgi:hypothetical protein
MEMKFPEFLTSKLSDAAPLGKEEEFLSLPEIQP